MAHLPLVLARRLAHQSAKLAKVPLRTHAEGGQVEPVLGRTYLDNVHSQNLLNTRQIARLTHGLIPFIAAFSFSLSPSFTYEVFHRPHSS
jgi:hypothetical protein